MVNSKVTVIVINIWQTPSVFGWPLWIIHGTYCHSSFTCTRALVKHRSYTLHRFQSNPIHHVMILDQIEIAYPTITSNTFDQVRCALVDCADCGFISFRNVLIIFSIISSKIYTYFYVKRSVLVMRQAKIVELHGFLIILLFVS